MKICIVTGGSGGHIYPALTFSDYLLKNDLAEVFYIGNDNRMEAKIIPEHGYPFYAIRNAGLQGSIFYKIYAMSTQFKAIYQARKHLKKLKPDLVFAFGGYVSLPVVLAAKSLKIKIALHEQNAFVGKANKWVSSDAHAIFTCYEEAFKGHENVYFYGNPRASLAKDVVKDDAEVKRIGLNLEKPIVLSVMGSQGATSINNMFSEAIKMIDTLDYQLVFVTGKNEFEPFMEKIDHIPENVFILDYVDQGKLLPYLDLIVSRAGASSITEIAAFGIPSILIPSPYVANNHQYFNAKALSDKDATILYEEKDLTPGGFLKTIEDTLNNQNTMNTLRENVKTLDTPNVNENIYRVLKQVIEDE